MSNTAAAVYAAHSHRQHSAWEMSADGAAGGGAGRPGGWKPGLQRLFLLPYFAGTVLCEAPSSPLLIPAALRCVMLCCYLNDNLCLYFCPGPLCQPGSLKERCLINSFVIKSDFFFFSIYLFFFFNFFLCRRQISPQLLLSEPSARCDFPFNQSLAKRGDAQVIQRKRWATFSVGERRIYSMLSLRERW